MSTLLFLLLFFFVLLPLGRIAWAFWRQYRMVKRHFRQAEEFRRTFEGAAGRRRDSRPEQPAPRKKKIAADVGEYVAFEEVRVYSADDSDSAPEPPRATPEKQVEAADWEEIK